MVIHCMQYPELQMGITHAWRKQEGWTVFHLHHVKSGEAVLSVPKQK